MATTVKRFEITQHINEAESAGHKYIDAKTKYDANLGKLKESQHKAKGKRISGLLCILLAVAFCSLVVFEGHMLSNGMVAIIDEYGESIDGFSLFIFIALGGALAIIAVVLGYLLADYIFNVEKNEITGKRNLAWGKITGLCMGIGIYLFLQYIMVNAASHGDSALWQIVLCIGILEILMGFFVFSTILLYLTTFWFNMQLSRYNSIMKRSSRECSVSYRFYQDLVAEYNKQNPDSPIIATINDNIRQAISFFFGTPLEVRNPDENTPRNNVDPDPTPSPRSDNDPDFDGNDETVDFDDDGNLRV